MTPSEPKFDAFLSYSSADRPAVRRIQRFLESYRPPNRSRHLKVYLDETDMRGGSLPENLSEAIADSHVLVVCWSERAASSYWVENEIREFRNLGQENRIAIVHVGGVGPTVKHEVFGGLKPIEHDMRHGWRAGILTPAGKTQLLRLIAFLTGVDMRALRNWARRRTLRNAFITLAVSILPVVGVLSLRIPTWELVPLSHYDQPIAPIACEVVDGKLWAASWFEAAGEFSGTRAYFVTYPDVLTNSEYEIPGLSYLVLPKRALPENMVSRELVKHVREILEANGLTAELAELAKPDVPRYGQPRPGHFVYILPYGEPDEEGIMYAGIDHSPIPETKGTYIVVHKNGSPPKSQNIDVFSPPRWQERAADSQRRTSPARGMSVVWQQNGEIWIGVPGERKIKGGLWHSPDAGDTWQCIDGFYNVTSIDLLPAINGREDTLVVAEQSFKRLQDTEYVPGSSRVMKRTSDGNWIPTDAPPHGTDSEIEICGTLPNGTLYARVDKQLYRQESLPLYRWMAGRLRSSHR